MSSVKFTVLLTMALLTAAGAALACVNPTGTEGQIVYNGTFKIPQYCNGTQWVAWGSGFGVSTDRITSGTTGVVTSNAGGGSITFTTGGTQRMVVDGSGRVGIGTNNPGAPLEVFTPSAFTAATLVNFRNSAGRLLTIQQADPLDINAPFFVTTANAIQFVIDDSPTLHIDAAGRVGISTDTPNQGNVEVKGGSVCVDTNSDNNATNCIASESDRRLKQNIKPLPNALETLIKLQGVTFDWRVSDSTVLKHYPLISRFATNPQSVGVIAQDVKPIYPYAIEAETVGDENVQYYQVDYTKFVPLLIESVKALKAENDRLRAEHSRRLNQLEAELQRLKR